jgi:phosphatidylglycerophosphate synthase
MTDGEVWTAEALAELRARRYTPMAWVRFIGASRERAAESRRVRPKMARQARRWGLVGSGAWLLALAPTGRRSGPIGGLVWWAAVYKMLDWHLGMAEGEGGEAREFLSPADMVTISRFWAVPLAVTLRESRVGLPVLVMLGGVSDCLDGLIARGHGHTRLGRDLDTTADMTFLCTTACAAGAAGRLPRIATAAIVARYALGTAMTLVSVFVRGGRPAIRARPIGGVLRFGGLAVATAGLRRLGTLIVVAGSLVPARRLF